MNRSSWDGELFVRMKNQGARSGYIDADLSGFRIHGASISGARTGTHQNAYGKDLERVFRDLCGRDWHPADRALQLFYRGEHMLFQAAKWFKSRGKRATV